MKSVALKAFPRTLARRAGVKKLRASGRVPAIIYGRRTSPQNLEIGQSIHLNEIPLPAGVEVIGDKNIPVISVAAPITEAQEAAALEAATTPLAEPEVIKEKKEEGEAETAGTAAKPPEKGGEKAAEKGVDKAAEKKAEKKK